MGATTLATASGFVNFYNAAGYLRGYYVNPKTNQNATSSLTDDYLYQIATNTSGSLTTTGGDMVADTGATGGDAFELVLQLDNLDVIGKANLNFAGQDILVHSGDLSNNNTTTFNQDGGITAGTVDVGSATWTTTANASGTVTTKCAANFACP